MEGIPNIYASQEVANEASKAHNDSITSLLGGVDTQKAIEDHAGQHAKTAAYQRREGLPAVFAEFYDRKAAEALRDLEPVFRNMHEVGESFLAATAELPLIKVDPAEVLDQYADKTRYYVADEINRLHTLGFTDEQIQFMAKGEVQLRSDLSDKIRAISAHLDYPGVVNRLISMENDPSADPNDIAEERDKVERMNTFAASRASTRVLDLLTDQYMKRADTSVNFNEFLDKQLSAAYGHRADFAPLDRLREAHHIAVMSSHLV